MDLEMNLFEDEPSNKLLDEVQVEQQTLFNLEEDLSATVQFELEVIDEIEVITKQLIAAQQKKQEIILHKLSVEQAIREQKRIIEEMKEAERLRLLELGKDQAKQDLVNEIAELTKDYAEFKRARHYQYDDILTTIEAYKLGKTGMLNANDVGAGKTFETVATVKIMSKMFEQVYGRQPNVLWLTKVSLTQSTPNEIQRWDPDARVLVPTNIAKDKSTREFFLEVYTTVGGIFLANYEFVRTTPKVATIPWDFVIVDEVHKLKGGANSNGPTAIWKAVAELCKRAKFNFFLSGTPMVNKAEEMWSYLHIFAPDRFPDIRKFKRDFCDYKYVASSGLMELAVDPNKILERALNGQMIRRSKKEFGIEMPELTVEDIILEMLPEQRAIYNQMRDRFFIWLNEQKGETLTAAAIIAQLTRLRQINSWPPGIKLEVAVGSDNFETFVTMDVKVDVPYSSKIDEAMDRIEMVTSIPATDEFSEQIIVGCTFNEPLNEIRSRCLELGLTCEIISGQHKHSGRDIEKEFQQGKIQVLCLNSAMGEGLNLQKSPEFWPGGASYGIIIDKWWNPSRQEQFIGRIHRPGDTKAVTVWNLVNERSVDGFIQAKNDEKSEAFESIMEDDSIRPADWKSYLEDLI